MPRITQLASVLEGTLTSVGILDQVTGEAMVVKEDLSNIVDIGKAVLDYTGASNTNYDSFVRSLIDHVGKVMFVDRTYASQAPNILMDSWEYGSVLEKVRCEAPDARDNATWDLFNYPVKDGDAYPDPFELSKPSVAAKFYNSKATYEVPITIVDVQLREAFQSASQLSAFVSMIENRIRMKMTLCNDALIMATIDNLIGQKAARGNIVNLLSIYNAGPNAGGTTVTAAKALTDKEFLRFASKTIAQYRKYLATASVLYNEGEYLTFTPADRLKFVASTEFAKSLDSYLYSDTYHNEFVNLNGYEEIAFWQGTGTTNDNRLVIDVTVDMSAATGVTTAEIADSGVLAVMFDRDAAAVCNQNYRVTSIYNPRGEYTNFFYKWDSLYMNDILENCVVFTIADPVIVAKTDTEATAYATAYANTATYTYVLDSRVGAPSDVSTSPANWSTTRAKYYNLVGGAMTAVGTASYSATTKYYYLASDKPAGPTT